MDRRIKLRLKCRSSPKTIRRYGPSIVRMVVQVPRESRGGSSREESSFSTLIATTYCYLGSSNCKYLVSVKIQIVMSRMERHDSITTAKLLLILPGNEPVSVFRRC